jgi:hypothetical protein
MRKILFFLVIAPALLAADAGFDGRWDITPGKEPRGRAWWLEIQGADTATPSGKFVSAFGGDMNVIQEITIRGNELQFGFRTNGRHLTYRARLAGGKLQGTNAVEGQRQPPLEWTGVRAPVIPDKDDGTWREGQPVELFNGKDLSGWRGMIPNKELGWSVKDGLLTSTGGANNVLSERKFWNFKLHVEFRLGAHSNSGVGLRGRYEVQIQDDYGKAPGTHTNGSIYSRIAPRVEASRPAGEWQVYDIRLVGRQVTVVLNGQTLIEKAEIEGLTAIAGDANEAEPGPIFLQGDHGPVEFRKVTLTPLAR